MMRRFKVYRPNPPEHYVSEGYANAADEVQIEGVEFSDGKVAIRWCTPTRSCVWWDSLEDFMKVHGHPEYGTKFEWID